MALFTSIYLLIFPTGVAALVGAATKTVGGVEGGGDATGTVADDTSEDVEESTGCRGSNLPKKGRMVTGVGSTSAVDFV